MKPTYKRICEDCGAEAFDGRNRCRTNGCNGFIVVATATGCGTKEKIVLIVNQFGNLQAQYA
jgi:hypothetical protein